MYDFSVLRQLRKREGLTIADLSSRSGVSPAVISKLERNQTSAELPTLFYLGRAFGMNATDLLMLAESRTAHRSKETQHQ
jgi:transcriptional regulator with XRE-family HTH domain